MLRMVEVGISLTRDFNDVPPLCGGNEPTGVELKALIVQTCLIDLVGQVC